MNTRKVDLIKWLPDHLSRIEEFKQMCSAEDIELQLLWEKLDAVALDMDMYKMSERMCERWEHFFGIRNTALLSLDDRRKLIRGYFTSQLPYTLDKLKATLDSMCGAENYTLEVDPGKKITIDIKLVSLYAMSNLQSVVGPMIPAHFQMVINVIYNRWKRFEALTWGELETETWESLYSDKKWQEGT